MRLSQRHWQVFILLLIIAGISLLRLHLKNIPLERDEGEYALAGQLLLRGIPPYTLAYSMKLPGVLFAYAAIMGMFGESVAAIHVGLLLINIATIVVLFFLGSRLLGPTGGLVASASYGLLSASPSVLGFAAHATNFVVLPAITGVLLLSLAKDKGRCSSLYFGAGLLFGIAFLMKQPALVFALFGYGCLFWQSHQNSEVRAQLPKLFGLYTGAVAVPFAVTCGIMLASRVFEPFWFWTFRYASQYASTLTADEALNNIRRSLPQLIWPSVGIWMLAIFGGIALFCDRTLAKHRFFLSVLLICSMIAVCPGMYFRLHYFVLVLPAISLFVGVAVVSAVDYLRNDTKRGFRIWAPVLVYLAIFAYTLYSQRLYLFQADPVAAARMTYGSNPFPEALDIARYIDRNSNTGDRIAVLGSEPEIYFYAHRLPATGYIYTYSLMEPQPYAAQMQSAMIREIENVSPEFIVFVSVPTSFGRLPGSDTRIFDWIDRYLPSQYKLVALQNVGEPLRSVEEAVATDYRPRPNEVIKIYKRRS